MTLAEDKGKQTAAEPNKPVDEAGLFFDRYAETWDAFYTDDKERKRAFDFINRQQQLLKLVGKFVPPESRILEFGCGAGHTALRLIESGHELTCLDVSNEMIEATRGTLERGRKTARLLIGQVSDVAVLEGELFDAVVGMGVMEYIPDHGATFQRLHQLLKPEGICLLSFPNAFSPIRQIERFAKRVASVPIALATGSQRYWDIALRPSKLHSPRKAHSLLKTAGFEVVESRYLSYGFRVGSFWLPPLGIVRSLEQPIAGSPLRWLGRNYIVVGRKAK